MSQPPPPPRRRRRIALAAFLAGLALACVLVAIFWPRPVPPAGELDAAVANARGVGLMERFEYAAAAAEFERAAAARPDWLAARVNHGIALFNQNTDEAIARARATFDAVLARDPDNRHALYCLGIIDMDRGRTADAYRRFKRVNELDPSDAHTWLRLAATQPDGLRSEAARPLLERALELNPYLNAARYNLMLVVGESDPARAAALEAEWKALVAANWEAESDIRYGLMGRYAEVIGRDASAPRQSVGPLPLFDTPANFRAALAPGARWATAADLDPLRKAAWARFGGTMIAFDFNKDGRPDVLLLSAVVQNGQVRDLLLRNDADGLFTDVTATAGLGTPRASLGAAAGDYDNDGAPDLAITGDGRMWLFRNKGNGTFEDVSAAAGFDKLKGVWLGCAWVDIDQDGDLDLVAARYAESAQEAGTFNATPKGGATVVLENIGEAPPAKPDAPGPGLTTRFRLEERFAMVAPAGGAVAAVLADLDSDQDVDLLVLLDGEAPVLVANDRLLRFHRSSTPWADSKARWNGGLILDANHDDRSDLLLLPADGPPQLFLSSGAAGFTAAPTNGPPLKQALAIDLDLDGWPDVVGVSAAGRIVLLHNKAGRLVPEPNAFGVEDQLPADIRAAACAGFTAAESRDLVVWTDTGLHLRRSLDNGNRGLLVEPTGQRDKASNQRTNSDGIGTRIVAQAGPHWTGAERTTVGAGLGQSLLPTTLGLGRAGRADAVRLRWPDAVVQAELDAPAGLFRVAETNRKGTSCPVLMTWDGDKFAFVTDFLGGGALGESGPDGSVRPPRPEESVKIEPHQLRAKDGQFVLKIAEPMDEVLYLDHLRLDVIDHPTDARVFPDERFVFAGPQPTQKLLAFRDRRVPKSATDHRGRDVTKSVLERDRRAVDGFAVRSWLGYAEDHSLTLDFGPLPAGEKWHLVLAGWTEYPYPESMFAATRSGVAIKPPVVETPTADGRGWEPLCDLGFPAGLPRVMTRELPAFKGGKLRIGTNMQVFWDQIYLARAESAEALGKVTSLDVARADLAARGFMQEVYPDGRPPVAYDDAKTEPVAVNKWKGNLTRLGDVTDLLRAADDRLVLCGPGDEITVRFDAGKLPALPDGWVRSFVLRTRGYCKDTSTTTVTGGSVGPLPFRAMPNYPDFGGVRPPAVDADKWHTRTAGDR